MITSEQKFRAILERIARFHNQAANLRKVETNPANYHAAVSGFLAEIDRMQREVREYLSLHPADLASTGKSWTNRQPWRSSDSASGREGRDELSKV
jgi:hypothetical protein